MEPACRRRGTPQPLTDPIEEPANVHYLLAEDDEERLTERDYHQMAALDPGYPPDAENEQ